MAALLHIASHRIMMFVWGAMILGLLAWTLSTDPPPEVVFGFVFVFGGLAMALAYQQGHSDAIRWAKSLLPSDR